MLNGLDWLLRICFSGRRFSIGNFGQRIEQLWTLHCWSSTSKRSIGTRHLETMGVPNRWGIKPYPSLVAAFSFFFGWSPLDAKQPGFESSRLLHMKRICWVDDLEQGHVEKNFKWKVKTGYGKKLYWCWKGKLHKME